MEQKQQNESNDSTQNSIKTQHQTENKNSSEPVSRPKGYAPIKPEFLKKESESNDNENQEEKRKADSLEAEGAPSKKKQRGMNKNRNNHKQALHAKGGEAPKQSGQRNFLPKDAQAVLKKKKYPYKRAEEKAQKARDFVKRMRQENEQFEKMKQQIVTKATDKNDNIDNNNTNKNEEENNKGIEEDNDTNNNNNETIQQIDEKNNENESETIGKLNSKEKHRVDFNDKLILAPLTTVGNLPFRRICKGFGADITVGEMAVGTNIIKGSPPEWALLRRHESEDIFGVQVALPNVDFATKTCELIDDYCDVDFVDLNCGCPIDLMCRKGMGSELPERKNRFDTVVRGMVETLSCPVTVKLRTGRTIKKPTIHNVFPRIQQLGASAVTLHGRSRQQRYTKEADWAYINRCAKLVDIPVIGNGDIFSHIDVTQHREDGIKSFMIGRGALIKPWLFQEIKEERYWDIRSTERLDILKKYAEYGLDHWGADEKGVMHTRRFLLEWLSFLHRYIPVGLLEVLPQRLNERPMPYYGRDELETMMASPNVNDWIKLTEMVLGPVPDGFTFVPKHKSNSYETQG